MNLVYYYDDNNQEPKPGDLLLMWTEKNQRNARYNFIGIVVSTSDSKKSDKSDNNTEYYNLETMVLKSDGTIVHRVLIWKINEFETKKM